MNPDRFERARELFHAACDLEPAARRRYLEQACSSDASLCDEVLALFDLEEAAGSSRLQSPAIGSSFLQNFDLNSAQTGDALPKRIGKFRIVEMLGEGSMGVVYLAEEDHPRRAVALKLPRDWGYSAARLRRFQREVDLLGRLQHPGIARVYGAGVADVETESGVVGRRPYFALERIEGERLLEYCAKAALGISERLQLAAAIAAAIHHAHCRGVIHRDLKPSNILVDASGQPKILDFGLSRAVDAGADASLRTEAGQILGTIAYASPEQLGGEQDGVDARADVYSLGVILFEMLTGELPIPVRDLDVPSAVRKIIDAEPASAARLNATLRGDIDAVLAKALEKDRARRYSSAAEFASDIRRHLSDEPIVARPITSAVVLRKALRKHRYSISLGVLSLVGALGGLSYGLLQAQAERDAARAAESRALIAGEAEKKARETAEREVRIADAVNAFLNDDLLSAANPDHSSNHDIRMREVLDIAAKRLDGKFPNDPLVEAAVRMTLGVTYVNLGEFAAAEPHLNRCENLRTAHLAADDPQLAETYMAISSLLYHRGQISDAATHIERLIEGLRKQPVPNARLLGASLASLGLMRMQLGDYEQALAVSREGVAHLRSGGSDPLELVRGLCNMAMCHLKQKDFEPAEAALREAAELGTKHSGPDHPDTINAKATLAAVLNDRSQYHEAIPLLKEIMEQQARVFGAEHPRYLVTQANLAFSYLHSERLDEAEPLILDVLDKRVRLLGEQHPHTLLSLMQRGTLHQKRGRAAEAELDFRRGVELTRDNPAISPQLKADWLSRLATSVESQGRTDEANGYRAQMQLISSGTQAKP